MLIGIVLTETAVSERHVQSISGVMLDSHNACTMWQAFTEVSTVTVQTGRCEAFTLRTVQLQGFGL